MLHEFDPYSVIFSGSGTLKSTGNTPDEKARARERERERERLNGVDKSFMYVLIVNVLSICRL